MHNKEIHVEKSKLNGITKSHTTNITTIATSYRQMRINGEQTQTYTHTYTHAYILSRIITYILR